MRGIASCSLVLCVPPSCPAARPALLDKVNSLLVVAVIASFLVSWRCLPRCPFRSLCPDGDNTPGGCCPRAHGRQYLIIVCGLHLAARAAACCPLQGLLGVAAGEVHPEQLAVANWGALPDALPIITLSFVYQNVVPVISTSLEGDIGKIRQAVLLGSLVPWLMFISWDAAILGSSAFAEAGAAAGAAAAAAGGGAVAAVVDPLAVLRESGLPAVGPLIDAFTFLAITTSFLGFVLGLSDFVADVIQASIPLHTSIFA